MAQRDTRGDSDLRERAEERMAAREAPAPRPEGADAERLLHELEVHRVELEMQNEELKAARLEAEQGLERYTEVFDFAPIGYAVLAPDERILELNLAAAQLLGGERSRLVGRSFGQMLPTEHREVFSALLARAHDSGERRGAELTLRPPGGSRPAFLARLTAAGLSRPEPMTLLAFEDVTERQEREDRLRRTEQALREAHRRKDEFPATLSHELRNPLAPVRSSLYVLRHVPPGGEQARRALGVIERQVDHLARLVEDLLDVTRVTRGKIRLQKQPLDLCELVRRTLEDHREGHLARGLRLEGRVAEGPCWVEADPARLVQVLSNLLSNAEKFTPEGGRVTVEVRCEDGRALLKVRDTGAGIAPELKAHLFEPFTQGTQTLDRTRGGLGLGLAMVKGLVELHEGRVGLHSDGPGKGAEFSITLPLTEAPSPAAQRQRERVTRGRRVLVIEDNQDAAESLKDVLSLQGHEVQVALDGAQGLELARAFHPEIVLCDLGLPGMDGYEVARAFR